MEWFLAHHTEVFAAIGYVVVAASAIVRLTPSTKDDEVLGKIIAFLERFSVFNKK